MTSDATRRDATRGDAARRQLTRTMATLNAAASHSVWRAAMWPLGALQVAALGALILSTHAAADWLRIGAGVLSTVAFGGLIILANRYVLQLGEALARAEDRLARQDSVIQSTTRSLSFLDRAGRVTWVNDAFVAETGYTTEEVRGRRPEEFLFADRTDAGTTARILEAMSAAQPIRAEVCQQAKSGRTSSIDLEIVPLHHRDGTHAGFVTLAIDLSSHVAMRERLSLIFNTVSEGVVMVAKNGAIVECNAAAERILGLPAAQLLGRDAVDPRWGSIRRDGSPLPDAETPAMITLRTGVPIRDFVHGVRLPDGTRHLLSISTEPLRDATGAVTGVVASFGDVTDMLDKDQRMQLVVQGAALGTWDWHVPSGAVIYNAQSAEMLGYSLSEYEPNVSMWEKLLHPEDKAEVMTVLTAHLTGQTPEFRCEHRQRRKDGTWAWVLGSGQVVERGPAGEPIRAVGINMDISVQKEFESALRLAQREAEDANAQLLETNRTLEVATVRAHDMAAEAAMASHAKSEFLANMSHEIRTPLTAILGYTDILAESLPANDAAAPASAAVETIQRAGQHLLMLINDVLDLSKIEAGRLSIEQLEMPLPELLLDVDSLMRARASAKGVALRTSLASPVPNRIISDPTRFRQILMNLVGNAAKFTDHGTIDVRACILPADGETAARLRVEVDDTGPGMTEKQSRILFQPFTQADASVTRRHGGTGLGLTICRRLAALMDGTVSLEYSQPGRGSRFVVELPLQPAPGSALVHSLDVCGKDNEPLGTITLDSVLELHGRILLAEDGEDNRRLIVHHLTRGGAEVFTAANGRIALEMLLEAQAAGRPFDLLVTDMQMPEMDGYTLACTLRDGGHTIPIVALTAHAMAEDRQRCLDAGCDAYESKPIQREALLRACAALLPPRPVTAEAAVGQPSRVDRASPQPTGAARPVPVTHTPETVTRSDDVLISDLADDPDMCGLIPPFLERLREQMLVLGTVREPSDRAALTTLAHQLKGAGGGYGFMPISQAARTVERFASAGGTQRECDAAVDALLALCAAAIRGGERSGIAATHASAAHLDHPA